MANTRTLETPDGRRIEYEPAETVSAVWIREMQAVGINPEMADQIANLTFGDPELSMGVPSVDDVYEVAEETLEQYDFESLIEEGTSAETLRARLLAVLDAGLRGQLLGPASAPKRIAVANDGIASIETKASDDSTVSPGSTSPSPEIATTDRRQQFAASVEGHEGTTPAIEADEAVPAGEIFDTLAATARNHPAEETRAAAIESFVEAALASESGAKQSQAAELATELADESNTLVSKTAVEALEDLLVRASTDTADGSTAESDSETGASDESTLSAEDAMPIDDPSSDSNNTTK